MAGLISAMTAEGDDISLTGDASLSGIIRSISGQGVVELSTPLSPEAVLLKPEAVEEVKFSAPQDRPEVPGAMVELVNGDQLPVVIEGLDDKSLTVVTPDAGRILIPREAVRSLQVGVHRQRTIYSGPKSAEEWTSDADNTRAWKIANDALVASGPAFASKNVNTPAQFVLKLSVKWQGNPNFQVYFADPLRPRGEAADRYYLQFAGAGMELKRESTTGNRFTTVILSNKTPDQFPDNKIDLEIRVDRKTARLHLLINGEVEGAGVDPTSAPPEGKGIALVSNVSNGNEQEVSGIEITELDDARGRHRSEPRGDAKTDSMISRDDDRWSGHLKTIVKSADGLVFSFKSDFQEAPLELLESDVSTVFMADRGGAAKSEAPQPFVLLLQDDGMLRVTSCSFTADAVSAVHPLLGSMSIRRSGVAALKRFDSKAKEEAPEE